MREECARERERERVQKKCAWRPLNKPAGQLREIERVYECVCLCARERERERERSL